MNKCHISFYLGLCISIFIILFINKMNFLDKVILQTPRITLWSITHFIAYYIVGKLCPNKYLYFIILGILWEIFEKVYGKLMSKEKYWTSYGSKGQIYDILFNFFGYHLAHKI